MLPIEKLPIDIGGLTPEMRNELEARVLAFEKEHEPEAAKGGSGYVPQIKKGDFLFAGVVNAVIVIYFIVAVLIM
ncbi:MAG: hypothetical protein HFE76_08250 [Firmicutes bacterium]|nr:hypothetical protein [Bacillota bacterium]